MRIYIIVVAAIIATWLLVAMAIATPVREERRSPEASLSTPENLQPTEKVYNLQPTDNPQEF